MLAANYLDFALVFTPSIINELFNLVLDLFIDISDSSKDYYWLSFFFYMWIEGAVKSLFLWDIGAVRGGEAKLLYCLLLLL